MAGCSSTPIHIGISDSDVEEDGNNVGADVEEDGDDVWAYVQGDGDDVRADVEEDDNDVRADNNNNTELVCPITTCSGFSAFIAIHVQHVCDQSAFSYTPISIEVVVLTRFVCHCRPVSWILRRNC